MSTNYPVQMNKHTEVLHEPLETCLYRSGREQCPFVRLGGSSYNITWFCYICDGEYLLFFLFFTTKFIRFSYFWDLFMLFVIYLKSIRVSMRYVFLISFPINNIVFMILHGSNHD